MAITYNKVTDTTPEVVTLATQLKVPPSQVAAMINQDRYRKAYNKQKLVRDKQMREFFREHPEMMPKGEKS